MYHDTLPYRVAIAALISIAMAACGGDSSSPMAPGGSSLPQVGGSWTYAAPNMTGTLSGGVSVSCRFSNVPLTLNQTGDTFTGSTSGGQFSCSAAGISDGGTLGGRIVVNGELSGNDVEFDFDGPDWHHTGSISGNSMSGQATAIFDLSSGSVVLRGNWSAAR